MAVNGRRAAPRASRSLQSHSPKHKRFRFPPGRLCITLATHILKIYTVNLLHFRSIAHTSDHFVGERNRGAFNVLSEMSLDLPGVATDFDCHDVGGGLLDAEAAEGFCYLRGS